VPLNHPPSLGQERPGQKATLILFADGSELLVHWDGRYEVSGVETGDRVTVYCPNGRRFYFSWRIIDSIEHQQAEEEYS
jgi:hypothetical protein